MIHTFTTFVEQGFSRLHSLWHRFSFFSPLGRTRRKESAAFFSPLESPTQNAFLRQHVSRMKNPVTPNRSERTAWGPATVRTGSGVVSSRTDQFIFAAKKHILLDQAPSTPRSFLALGRVNSLTPFFQFCPSEALCTVEPWTLDICLIQSVLFYLCGSVYEKSLRHKTSRPIFQHWMVLVSASVFWIQPRGATTSWIKSIKPVATFVAKGHSGALITRITLYEHGMFNHHKNTIIDTVTEYSLVILM